MKKGTELITTIPIKLALQRQTTEAIVSIALEQYEKFGFTTFIFHFPSLGHGGTGYPSQEEWIEGAQKFVEVKKALQPYGIECAWWMSCVLRLGQKEGFSKIVDHAGIENDYSLCPLNENFKEQVSDDVALFAKIAKPSFIITEDDFCVHANAWRYGCLCDLHLKGFEKWTVKSYTREELTAIFDSKTKESLTLLRTWREFTKDSTVKLAERIREKLDLETPEIPMGTMESFASDMEDLTEALARALAGKRHTPFSRLYGASYNGYKSEDIPRIMAHSLYERQHIGDNFIFLHESDSFPSLRYFSSATVLKAVMSTAYSYGFDGSNYNNMSIQMIDFPNEEKGYGAMFAVERARFNALHEKVRECELDGVGILYDPFWNTVDADHRCDPMWVKPLSNMGIPYTTKEAKVTCMDWVHAKYLEDSEILRYLSKGLLLDGDAAKILCERGYSEYLGVWMGDDVAVGMYQFDLGAREVIREEFLYGSPGKEMAPAHWFANGYNGKLYKMDVIDEKCEIITEEINENNELVSVAMTRFENKLGGRIMILGQTLENKSAPSVNQYSQSLYNYRRQRIFQEMIKWCGGEHIMSKDIARIHTIVNKPKVEANCDFKGIVTLVNISDDEHNEIILDLGGFWNTANDFYVMDENGNWQKADYIREGSILKIRYRLGNLSSLYVMLK